MTRIIPKLDSIRWTGYPFETRRPIAASGQMLILYGVKSAGSLEKTTSIEIGRGFPYPFLILPLRLDSIRSIGVRQHFARGMIYIQSGYTGWIGTLRKGVVFQVSREKKREDRGGEGSGGGGIIDGGTQRVVRRGKMGRRAHLASNQSVAISTCVHGTLKVAGQSTGVHLSSAPLLSPLSAPRSPNFISHNRASNPERLFLFFLRILLLRHGFFLKRLPPSPG